MISRTLAVAQLVEPYKQLSGLHYMEKNDRNLLADFHRYNNKGILWKALFIVCWGYIKNHSGSWKGNKTKPKIVYDYANTVNKIIVHL